MEWNWNETKEWTANIVLMTLGYFTRLVFGEDKLTKWQLIAFYGFCVGVVWIVNKIPASDIIRSSIMLCCGLIMPNVIKGIISGAKKSQKKVSESIEHNVENISERVEDIADALTKKKK